MTGTPGILHTLSFEDEEELDVCMEGLRRLRLISHPHIAGITEIKRKDNTITVLTDSYDGISLKSFIDGGRSLSDKEIIMLGLILCDSLLYLHECKVCQGKDPGHHEGIIYGNLSPEYVFVTSGGDILLKNPGECFGYRLCSRAYDISSRNYAAPEVLCGKQPDERTDVYGVGITMLYCMGSRKPGVHLQMVLDRCINREPDLRYGSMHELAASLRKVLISGRGYDLGKFAVKVMIVVTFVSFLLAAIFKNYYPESFKDPDGDRHPNVSDNWTEVGNFSDQAAISTNGIQDFEKGFIDDNYYDNSVTDQPSIDALPQLQNAIYKHEEAERLMSAGVDDEKNLTDAMKLLLQEREILSDLDNEAALMDYRTQNLSMLSTIYRLLGRKCPDEKKSYYEKSLECIENLFDLEGVKQTELYRLKTADIVLMKQEMGDKKGAIECLREWERGHPDEGIELYIDHINLLMEEGGNEKEVEELYEKMLEFTEAEQDHRISDIQKRVREYCKGR